PGRPAPNADRNPWAGERELLEQVSKPLPRQACALAATAQPFVPSPLRGFDEPQHTAKVAADAEVVAVASHALTERGVLRLDRLVPMATTPVVDGLLGPSESLSEKSSWVV